MAECRVIGYQIIGVNIKNKMVESESYYIIVCNELIMMICISVYKCTTKGGSRRLEKSHNVWMMMMIAASLMWAGAAEKPEQSKMTFKNHQNDLK